MSCIDNCRDGKINEEEFRRPGGNRVADDSLAPDQHALGKNCSYASSQLDIDENLLIDPKLLYIGAKIGEGAHGKVYQGKYHDQIVAIKVLNSGSTTDEKATLQARFIREVNMMSRVQHENLVQFVGACKDPFMVIATELLPGTSLKKYLSSIRPKQLEIHKAIRFALDIARAMDCLHANGIIHRDLKPDNLLLTANQNNVKLIDFGLAREETVDEMMTAETGTYRWMAPELYSTVTLRRGEKKHYTNKVDVYSFGIVLWELLTNRMPFEGMSNLQAAYAAAFKQMRPPLPDDAPPELVFLVQSCWVEDPNTRPSFSQIIRMLNAFLYTLPQASSPEPETSFPSLMSTSGTITTTSARRGGKLNFLRQLFAAKKIQEANIAKETKQFTYKDGAQYVFMDLTTFEESRLTEADVGDKKKWLKEGMDCNLLFWNGRVIDFELPIIVKLTVVDADPGLKGDTAQGGSKPATLDTGAVVNVPLFVSIGEEILVDTRTGQYTSRA